MIAIQEVNNLDIAFGGKMNELLPPYEEIPDEYKDGHTKWNKLFNDWFFGGLTELNLTPKEGVVRNKALSHIRAIMVSFEPQHEHKEAGVAYLMSEWFEDVQWTKAG